MKKIQITAIFALFLAIFGCNDGNKPATTDGKSIFTAKCQLCHGADGKLGLNGAKDLSASPLNLDQRIEVITLGRNTMTPFQGILSKEEIKAVAEYTMKLGQ